MKLWLEVFGGQLLITVVLTQLVSWQLGPNRHLPGLRSNFAATGLLLHGLIIVALVLVNLAGKLGDCDMTLHAGSHCTRFPLAVSHFLSGASFFGTIYCYVILGPACVLYLGYEVLTRILKKRT